MDKNKIFCIGMCKTGTTSLYDMFKDWGYNIGEQRKGELLMDDYIENNFKPIIDFCYSGVFFQDLPFAFPETYKYLDKEFPDSKFILTLRYNSDIWYNSLVKFHRKMFYGNNKITAESMKNVTYVKKLWLYNLFTKVFKTPNNDLYNEKILKNFYDKHNEDIINYFKDRPDKILIINLSEKDDFKKMLNFLNISEKTKINSFYHSNKT